MHFKAIGKERFLTVTVSVAIIAVAHAGGARLILGLVMINLSRLRENGALLGPSRHC